MTTDTPMDTRWKQRFSNYTRALHKLSLAVETVRLVVDASKNGRQMNEEDQLQLEGLIQRFEYTHELAWNTMADYAKYQGFQEIRGSRDAIRYALSKDLIDDPQWMNTIHDRNQTSHTYDEATVLEIVIHIIEIYEPLFCKFAARMSTVQGGDQQTSRL